MNRQRFFLLLTVAQVLITVFTILYTYFESENVEFDLRHFDNSQRSVGDQVLARSLSDLRPSIDIDSFGRAIDRHYVSFYGNDYAGLTFFDNRRDIDRFSFYFKMDTLISVQTTRNWRLSPYYAADLVGFVEVFRNDTLWLVVIQSIVMIALVVTSWKSDSDAVLITVLAVFYALTVFLSFLTVKRVIEALMSVFSYSVYPLPGVFILIVVLTMIPVAILLIRSLNRSFALKNV